LLAFTKNTEKVWHFLKMSHHIRILVIREDENKSPGSALNVPALKIPGRGCGFAVVIVSEILVGINVEILFLAP
jgi:hypothetical protein